MDDRYLKYLKETEPLKSTPIEGWIEPELPTATIVPKVNVLDQDESAKVEQIVDNDQTQPEQPMNVQAEMSQPTNEKELIKAVFSKIGWDKYIKEEPVNANGQNT